MLPTAMSPRMSTNPIVRTAAATAAIGLSGGRSIVVLACQRGGGLSSTAVMVVDGAHDGLVLRASGVVRDGRSDNLRAGEKLHRGMDPVDLCGADS